MNVAEGAWGAGVGPQTYGSGQHNTLACSKLGLAKAQPTRGLIVASTTTL